MTFHPASPLSLAAFLAVVAAVVLFFVGALHHVAKKNGQPEREATRTALKALFLIIAWNGIVSAVVGRGWIEGAIFPRLPLLFLTLNLMGLLFAFSRFGTTLAAGVPWTVLMAFQGFRLPLELVLHSWAGQGTIPETMTWTGQNWDVLTGVIALIGALLAARLPSIRRALAWAVNGIGFVLLLNVGRVAMLSSPLPFAWKVEPPLLLAVHVPYVWIGSVCVAGALAGHVILTRALLLRKPS